VRIRCGCGHVEAEDFEFDMAIAEAQPMEAYEPGTCGWLSVLCFWMTPALVCGAVCMRKALAGPDSTTICLHARVNRYFSAC
jgi:hypothetical protein